MKLDSIKAASVILKTCNNLNIDLTKPFQNSSFADIKVNLLLNLINGAEDYSKKTGLLVQGDKLFIFSSACYYIFPGFDISNEDYLDRIVMRSGDNSTFENDFLQFFKSGYQEVFTIPERDTFSFQDDLNIPLKFDFPSDSYLSYREPIAIHLNYLKSTRRAITFSDYYDFAVYFVFMFIQMFFEKTQIKLLKSISDRIIDDIFRATEGFNLQLSKATLAEMVYDNIKNPYIITLRKLYFEYLYKE